MKPTAPFALCLLPCALCLSFVGGDPRLVRYPGMDRPMEEKRAALHEILRQITAARRVFTHSQAVEERLAA